MAARIFSPHASFTTGKSFSAVDEVSSRDVYKRQEQHDEMIAFTSQLAHVASNAYIKSPTAKKHKGFSAGSYKDMTRVAWLAPRMGAELFLENRDFLLKRCV